MAASCSLRRDHRLLARVVEARFPDLASDSIDAFAVLRVVYAANDGGALSIVTNTGDDRIASAPGTLGSNGQLATPPLPPAAPQRRKRSLIPRASPSLSPAESRTAPQTYKTHTVRGKDKDKSVFWDQEFEVEFEADLRQVDIEVWSKRLLKDTLMGTATIHATQLAPGKPTESWHPLKLAESSGNSGSIRIRLTYTNEYILPLPVFKPLVTVMIDPQMHVITCMERVVEDRDETARVLLHVMFSIQLHDQYLESVCAAELEHTADPALLFRANSLASKSVDHFMKLVAVSYLGNLLRPVIKTIMTDNRKCELDPLRMTDRTAGVASSGSCEHLEESLVVLESYIKWIVERLVATIDDFPPQLRSVFAMLRARVTRKWPDHPECNYTVVSSFLFLRFINAAILGPKLFGLCDTFPNPTVARTLTLVSKSLQQLANFSTFDGAKEPFMTPLNPILTELIPTLKAYLDAVSQPVVGGPSTPGMSSTPSSLPSSPVTPDTPMSLSVHPGATEARSPGTTRRRLVHIIFGKDASSSSSSSTSTPALDKGSGGRSGSSSAVSTLGLGAPEPLKSFDIERQLSDLFRLLSKNIAAMQAGARPVEAPTINRLAIILREIASIKQRRLSQTPSQAILSAVSSGFSKSQSDVQLTLPTASSTPAPTSSSSSATKRPTTVALVTRFDNNTSSMRSRSSIELRRSGSFRESNPQSPGGNASASFDMDAQDEEGGVRGGEGVPLKHRHASAPLVVVVSGEEDGRGL
ncbi:RasGAP-activating-like protein 1 [Allomyces arbusculus]|nr:RasGAP-activating-like protein 1 [Allomyces arbusculus]